MAQVGAEKGWGLDSLSGWGLDTLSGWHPEDKGADKPFRPGLHGAKVHLWNPPKKTSREVQNIVGHSGLSLHPREQPWVTL